MSEAQQQTIFGEQIDEQIRFKAKGRVIRPFKRMVGEVADEFRLVCGPNTVSVEVVNRTNTLAIKIEMPVDALDDYTGEVTTLGINTSSFGSALRHTRYSKSTNDTVTISADPERMETETVREVGEATAYVTEQMALIDPDGIRKSPEIPELDLGVSVDLSPETFIEAVKILDTDSSDAIHFDAGNSVKLYQDTDIDARCVELDVPVEGEGEALFSPKRIKEISNALRNGYVDNLTLTWGEEMPIFAEFEREGVYSGRLMLAPRVKS